MSAESLLTPAQSDDLRAIAGVMIPASAEFDVPGADDPAIQADIVATLGRDAGLVRAGAGRARAPCRAAARRVSTRRGARRSLWNCARRAGRRWRRSTRVVLQCYYRDDRVVRSLGLEPRPPYPKGHVLEDGDWSLLDPVRARPPMWRRA